jgi:hypothetical protein
MARVSICDYCKKISKDDLYHFIDLLCESEKFSCHEDETHFEICKGCFVLLKATLSAGAPLPQAPTLPHYPMLEEYPAVPYSDTGISTSDRTQPIKIGKPTDSLLDHEIAIVPSLRDEVPDEDKRACKHKWEYIPDPIDPHMGCSCGAKMESESFD